MFNIVDNIDDLVKIQKPQKSLDEEYSYEYEQHMRIFWKSSSYAEYILKCTIAGVEPLFTQAEFIEMQDQKSYSLGSMFGMHMIDMFDADDLTVL